MLTKIDKTLADRLANFRIFDKFVLLLMKWRKLNCFKKLFWTKLSQKNLNLAPM